MTAAQTIRLLVSDARRACIAHERYTVDAKTSAINSMVKLAGAYDNAGEYAVNALAIVMASMPGKFDDRMVDRVLKDALNRLVNVS